MTSTGENPFGTVAVMGGGSWATALASLLMRRCDRIVWYMRRNDRIDDFRRLRHNPVYLSDITFDVDRIDFTADINAACDMADTLLLAMPSPYFKSHADKIDVAISGKTVISAVKGIVPDDNLTVTDYMSHRFGVDEASTLAIGGPCHAEEIALGRRSYLTVGCDDMAKATDLARLLTGGNVSAVASADIEGIEYAAVLKNVYAIAAGMVHGLKMGDNFLAVLVSNAIREMERFLNAVCPSKRRNICDSAYLGDLLVTCYSRFSRNHNFGSIIGRGYSVKAARMEMEQTAEGYFGTKCIHEINERTGVEMPLLEGVHDILYGGAPAAATLREVSASFS